MERKQSTENTYRFDATLTIPDPVQTKEELPSMTGNESGIVQTRSRKDTNSTSASSTAVTNTNKGFIAQRKQTTTISNHVF